MADPQRRQAPNVFELLTENEQLRRRIEELETRLAAMQPQQGERLLFEPVGLIESEVGAARKLLYLVLYNEARQNEDGCCTFTDRELGRRTGTDRTAACHTRKGCYADKLVEEAGYTPQTGVRKLRVPKAADAWEAIRVTPGTAERQNMTFFGAWEAEGSASGSASPVGSSESPNGSRMAPGDAIEVRGAERPVTQPAAPPASHEGDEPPLSLAEEARLLRLQGVNFTRGKFTPPASDDGECEDLQRENSQQPPDSRVEAVNFPRRKFTPPPPATTPDDGRASPRVRACGTSNKASNANGSPAARISESSSSCGAQDLGALGAAAHQVVAESLDVDAQTRRRADVQSVMARLIEVGGIAPNGRLRPHGAWKIAKAIVAGWLDWENDIERLLNDGAAKVLQGKCAAPYVYLLGTVDQILIERERPPIFTGCRLAPACLQSERGRRRRADGAAVDAAQDFTSPRRYF